MDNSKNDVNCITSLLKYLWKTYCSRLIVVSRRFGYTHYAFIEIRKVYKHIEHQQQSEYKGDLVCGCSHLHFLMIEVY